jgi:predicted RNA-binding Zn-ribbon protein involved in translation (DUF1610 family)
METETNTTAETTQAEFICPKCPERGPFKNKLALTMHTNRVHTKKIQVPLQGMDKSKKKHLAKRREYQRKLRERYKLQGKDSRGYLKKKPAFGSAWTPERRAKFEKTWRAKNKAKLNSKKDTDTQKFVQDLRSNLVNNAERLEDPRDFINCCPNCGTNLQAYYLAARAAKRHVR